MTDPDFHQVERHDTLNSMIAERVELYDSNFGNEQHNNWCFKLKLYNLRKSRVEQSKTHEPLHTSTDFEKDIRTTNNGLKHGHSCKLKC